MTDKMTDRMMEWRHKTLSIVGRLVLIKSITAALPIYTMQTTTLLSSVGDKIDKLNRDFLWGHEANKSKPNLVDCESVCHTKKNGGLGVRKTKIMN